jgi:hypothetical protein
MQESVIEESILSIRNFIKTTLKGAPQRLAKLALLNRNTLAGFADKGWNPTADTLKSCLVTIARHERGEIDLTDKKRNRKKKAKK